MYDMTVITRQCATRARRLDNDEMSYSTLLTLVILQGQFSLRHLNQLRQFSLYWHAEQFDAEKYHEVIGYMNEQFRAPAFQADQKPYFDYCVSILHFKAPSVSSASAFSPFVWVIVPTMWYQ